jgi:hypothetical protein
MFSHRVTGQRFDSASLLGPLRAALEVAVAGAHPWDLMRALCIQIIECYGDHRIPLSEDASERIKLAVMYLVTAIKLGNQQVTITKKLAILSADKVFAVAADELSMILTQCSSSSATPLPSAVPVAAVAAPTGTCVRRAHVCKNACIYVCM